MIGMCFQVFLFYTLLADQPVILMDYRLMDKKLQIDLQRVPKHVAIIMDGNGRWAKGKGMERIFGHKNALTAVRESIEGATKIGVSAITLYAFSTENWNRPKVEIDALMNLLISSLKKELPTFQENGVKVNAIGSIENLPKKAQVTLRNVILDTQKNDVITLTLALSYGSREEIVNAMKTISKKVVNKELDLENIDENTFDFYI